MEDTKRFFKEMNEDMEKSANWGVNPVHERLVVLNKELNALWEIRLKNFCLAMDRPNMRDILVDITAPKKASLKERIKNVLFSRRDLPSSTQS